MEKLIEEINTAGYRVALYQFPQKWEASAVKGDRAQFHEITFGETVTEALQKLRDKIHATKSEEDYSDLC